VVDWRVSDWLDGVREAGKVRTQTTVDPFKKQQGRQERSVKPRLLLLVEPRPEDAPASVPSRL